MIVARNHYFNVRFMHYCKTGNPRTEDWEACKKLAKDIESFPNVVVTDAKLENPVKIRRTLPNECSKKHRILEFFYLWNYKVLYIDDANVLDQFMKLLEESTVKVVLEYNE